jgi:phosphate-selective porin OprO/OprP
MKKIIFISIVVITSISCLNGQTTDKEIKFGGRIMYDIAAWDSENSDNSYGAEFRRVRLYNSGNIYGNVKYKLQLDFAGRNISYKDVFIELSEPILNGNIRVGHFKEPLRLESLTSSKYITFMERALPIAFAPERNTGIMYHTTIGDKISLQAGGFFEANSYGNDKELTNKLNITSRLTYLVMNNEDNVLHIGVANSRRDNSANTYSFSSRAENHLGTKLLEAGFTDVEKTNILGAEIAYVRNRLSLQGEYLRTIVSLIPQMELHSTEYELNGYYGQVSYFLSGESRPYKSSYAGFSRVKPNNNYGPNGKGAIELVARISKMDLSNAAGGIQFGQGGSLDCKTIGVNWYLNPNTRVMFNYVMGELAEGNEFGIITQENSVMMRVQLDF